MIYFRLTWLEGFELKQRYFLVMENSEKQKKSKKISSVCSFENFRKTEKIKEHKKYAHIRKLSVL
jgi:hypothetical protein